MQLFGSSDSARWGAHICPGSSQPAARGPRPLAAGKSAEQLATAMAGLWGPQGRTLGAKQLTELPRGSPSTSPPRRQQCRKTLLVTRHCPMEMRMRENWCVGGRGGGGGGGAEAGLPPPSHTAARPGQAGAAARPLRQPGAAAPGVPNPV